MNKRLSPLPKWVLTDTRPAIYDVESATCVEQTAKVYAKIQELVNDYNLFVDEVNTCIEKFMNDTNADYECFKNEINKIRSSV